MSLYGVESYLRNSEDPIDQQLAYVVGGILQARGGNDIPLSALADLVVREATDPTANDTLQPEPDTEEIRDEDRILVLHNPSLEDLKFSPAQLEHAAQNRFNLDTAVEQVTNPYLGIFEGYRPQTRAPRYRWQKPKKLEHEIKWKRSNIIGRYAMEYDGVVTFTSVGEKTDLQEVNIKAAPGGAYTPSVKFSARFRSGTITTCGMRDVWHPENPAYPIYDTDSVLAGSESAHFVLTGDTPTLLLDHGRHTKGGPMKALFKFDPVTNEFCQHAHTTNRYPMDEISVDEYTYALTRLLGIIPTSNLSGL